MDANDGWQRWAVRAVLGLATFGIAPNLPAALLEASPMQTPVPQTLLERIAALELKLAEGPPVTAEELRLQLHELPATLENSGSSGPWNTLTALGLGVLAAGYLAYAKASAERTARTELLLKFAKGLNEKADLKDGVAPDASMQSIGKPRGPQQGQG